MMDLRTMMTVSTLLLVTADNQTVTLNGTQNFFPAENDTIPVGSPTASTSSPSQCAPTVGILTIKWIRDCKGEVELLLHSPSSISFPVCHNSQASVKSLLENVCNSKKGCKGKPQWDKGGAKPSYSIGESGAEEATSCETLRVKCAVEVPDVQGQLHTYKVVTALLCCVLLVLLLIRFTRPTVKALQKRLSDRRQNRWIGPTQSHSVSYHRGKAAVKNNDREMRLSYPALERLAVSDSREPSSNRNSGYNF